MAASCAPAVIGPASQPSGVPSQFEAVQAGYIAPAPGFYLSIDGARALLLARAQTQLEIQRHIAIMQAEREADVKQASHADWCLKWCLPLGGFAGLFLGGLAGFGVEMLTHR